MIQKKQKLIRTSEESESAQLLQDVILNLSKLIAQEIIKFSLEVVNEAVRGGVETVSLNSVI